MSNNNSIIHLGADVAKSKIDLYLRGTTSPPHL